jgi:hypothetical protein
LLRAVTRADHLRPPGWLPLCPRVDRFAVRAEELLPEDFALRCGELPREDFAGRGEERLLERFSPRFGERRVAVTFCVSSGERAYVRPSSPPASGAPPSSPRRNGLRRPSCARPSALRPSDP